MKRYAFIVKNDEYSKKIATILEEKLNTFLIKDQQNPEVVISIGGDGTLLYAVHSYPKAMQDIYFVGVHTGTLGFYTDYLVTEIDELVDMLKASDYQTFARDLLRIDVCKDNDIDTYYALNEARIENNYYTQTLEVYIDEELLEVYRGNGLCISTNTGSTAYNKSLGGSVIDPGTHVMQLTEIAGIGHNAYRSLGSPIVLSKQHTITLQGIMNDNAVLGVDHITYPIQNGSSLRLTLSDKKVHFISNKNISFVRRIRKAFIY